MEHLRLRDLLIVLLLVAVPTVANGQEDPETEEVTEEETAAQAPMPEEKPAAEPAGQSLEEVNRQLNNPLTSLWSLQFQSNTQWFDGDAVDDAQLGHVLVFQPVTPISLGNYVLIPRPIIPLVSIPIPDGAGGAEVKTGLGDIGLFTLFGPKSSGGLIWGVGVYQVFPTATDDALGTEKVTAGPAALALYLGKPWVAGALVLHSISYAGSDSRADVHSTNVQYFVNYTLASGWQIGMSPNIVIDWENDDLTVPVGLGAAKVFKLGPLPVKVQLEAQYSVVTPDAYGTLFNLRLQLTPVIPSLF